MLIQIIYAVRASVQVGTAEETTLEDSSVACVKTGKASHSFASV